MLHGRINQLRWLTARCAMSEVCFEGSSYPTLLLALASLGYRPSDPAAVEVFRHLLRDAPRLTLSQLDGTIQACTGMKVKDTAVMVALGKALLSKVETDQFLEGTLLSRALVALFDMGLRDPAIFRPALGILEQDLVRRGNFTVSSRTLRLAAKLSLPFSHRAAEKALDVIAGCDSKDGVTSASLVRSLYYATKCKLQDYTSAVGLLRIIESRKDLTSLGAQDIVYLSQALVKLKKGVTDDVLLQRVMLEIINTFESRMSHLYPSDITAVYLASKEVFWGEPTGKKVESMVLHAITNPAMEKKWNTYIVSVLLRATLTHLPSVREAEANHLLTWCDSNYRDLDAQTAATAVEVIRHFGMTNTQQMMRFQTRIAASPASTASKRTMRAGEVVYALGNVWRNSSSTKEALETQIRHIEAVASSLKVKDILTIMYDIVSAKSRPESQRVAEILQSHLALIIEGSISLSDIKILLKYFIFFNIPVWKSINMKISNSLLQVQNCSHWRECVDILHIVVKLKFSPQVAAHVSALIRPHIGQLPSKETSFILSSLYIANLHRDPTIEPCVSHMMTLENFSGYELQLMAQTLSVVHISEDLRSAALEHVTSLLQRSSDSPSLYRASAVLSAMARCSVPLNSVIQGNLDRIVATNLTAATITEAGATKQHVVSTLVSLSKIPKIDCSSIIPYLYQRVQSFTSMMNVRDTVVILDALTRLVTRYTTDTVKDKEVLAVFSAVFSRLGEEVARQTQPFHANTAIVLLTALERIAHLPEVFSLTPEVLEATLHSTFRNDEVLSQLRADDAVGLISLPTVPVSVVISALSRLAHLAQSRTVPSSQLALALSHVAVRRASQIQDKHQLNTLRVSLEKIVNVLNEIQVSQEANLRIDSALKDLGFQREGKMEATSL